MFGLAAESGVRGVCGDEARESLLGVRGDSTRGMGGGLASMLHESQASHPFQVHFWLQGLSIQGHQNAHVGPQ